MVNIANVIRTIAQDLMEMFVTCTEHASATIASATKDGAERVAIAPRPQTSASTPTSSQMQTPPPFAAETASVCATSVSAAPTKKAAASTEGCFVKMPRQLLAIIARIVLCARLSSWVNYQKMDCVRLTAATTY